MLAPEDMQNEGRHMPTQKSFLQPASPEIENGQTMTNIYLFGTQLTRCSYLVLQSRIFFGLSSFSNAALVFSS